MNEEINDGIKIEFNYSDEYGRAKLKNFLNLDAAIVMIEELADSMRSIHKHNTLPTIGELGQSVKEIMEKHDKEVVMDVLVELAWGIHAELRQIQDLFEDY